MLLKVFHGGLVQDKEKTYLTATAAAAATALTVVSTDIAPAATSMTIDREGQSGGLRYAHSVGEPIYRIDFNQVVFYNNSTNTSTGATVLTTINLQIDDEFTRYEDTANTTGYGFARFKNATSGAFSSYS